MTFTSAEVSQLTGATLRQLQWWDERGIVVPARERHARHYTQEAVIKILALLKIRSGGITVQAIRKIKPKAWKDLIAEATLVLNGLRHDPFLLIDPKTLRMVVVSDRDEAIETLLTMSQPALMLSIDDLIHPLEQYTRKSGVA